MDLDVEQCWRAVQSRDARFDGWFYSAVTTTGIYCRPSCPARPHRANLRFFRSAAAAQAGGFRACKRCRPDAVPGSPEWNSRADLVGRAMRLIADGVVDRDGVDGLARQLGYTARHVHRMLTDELGAGPQALARAQRAHTARLLLETTHLKMADVAFAAGFASIRQYNDTVREVYSLTPSQLRAASKQPEPATGTLTLRLPYRRPFHAAAALDFLRQRAVTGVEHCAADSYVRSLRLPHGAAVVALTPADGHVQATLRLEDMRDLAAAVHRTRRMLDLDADPVAVDDLLGADPTLARLVAAAPGLRVPAYADPDEAAIRAVIGQQVSVAGARTTTARLVRMIGTPLPWDAGAVTHLFPTAEQLASIDPDTLPMPRSRGRALHALADALASGRIRLDGGADRAEVSRQLLDVAGIGPWTAAYVALRGLGDPDAFLPTDLGVRRALQRHGRPTAPAAVDALAERWRPWRAYAVMHLWHSLHAPQATDVTPIGALPA